MSAQASDIIGLDVGGTFLKGARVDTEGRVLDRLHQPIAKESTETLLAQLAAAAATLEAGVPAAAIGLGVPGIVERNTRVRAAPALPCMNGVAVGEELSRRTGHPTFVENDANAAALAEAWVGAGRGAESLFLISLGTGVGGGIVLGGRVWSGRSGYAGEVGHMPVDIHGQPCKCGSWGCVETFAGAPYWVSRAEALLARRTSALEAQPLSPETIVAAARDGDALALEVVNGATGALGAGIAAVLLLLNIERVVVGGGVAAAGEFLLTRIVEQVRRRIFPQVFADCSFRLAELGGDAGVVGAARVALQAIGSR